MSGADAGPSGRRRLVPAAPQAAALVFVVTGCCLLFAVVLGALWAAWSPRAAMTADGAGGFSITEVQLAPMLTGELAFGVGAILAGVLVAVALYAWRRTVGPLDAVACAVGGLAGSLVAARIGIWLGGRPGVGADLPAGADVPLALRVSISALELAWPIASVLVIMLVAVWTDDRQGPRSTADALSAQPS